MLIRICKSEFYLLADLKIRKSRFKIRKSVSIRTEAGDLIKYINEFQGR